MFTLVDFASAEEHRRDLLREACRERMIRSGRQPNDRGALIRLIGERFKGRQDR